MLQEIDLNERGVQGLILAPTRELAIQIERVVTSVGDHMNVKCFACIGGTSRQGNAEMLKAGAHVIVGTPGRVYDMLQRRILDVSKLKIIVLDEADEMLSFGFKDILYDIFQEIPSSTQVGLFSATMPNEVLEVARKITRDPLQISVKQELLTLQGIRQYFIDVQKDEWKLDTLVDLYDDFSINQAIIFCNTRRRVDMLTEELTKRDFTVSATHGELDPKQRSQIIEDFRSGSSRVLVTTDLLARGLDIQQINVVINYDLPRHKENYLHRIGRSGRFGRKGIAINLVTASDTRTLRDLEQFYNTVVEPLPANLRDLL